MVPLVLVARLQEHDHPEIFGPLPFREVATKPEWHTSTVAALARGIYAEKAFDRLLAVIKRTSGAERNSARLHLLDLFEILPPEDDRLKKAR